MDAIDILEKRIEHLEKLVFGYSIPSTEDIKQPVTDLLLHTNTLTSSALSGRESINTFLTRLPELNEYLDPACEHECITTEEKRRYLATFCRDIVKSFERINIIAQKSNVLDSDTIKQVPVLWPSLEKQTAECLNSKEDSDRINQDILELLQEYNDIMQNVSKMLAQVDCVLTEIEIARQPKKVIE